MKIGILTQPLHTNYGGLLQAFALQTVLRRMGHEVCVLDRNSSDPSWKKILKTLKYALLCCMGKAKKEDMLQLFITSRQRKVIGKYTSRFKKQYIKYSSPLYSSKELLEESRERGIEAYVVGSDQVWRPKYSPCITNYFLDFDRRKEITRIAYAASFGVDSWEFSPKQQEVCAALAKEFTAISVREDSAVALCRDYLGIKARHVLDPTLLLKKEDYENLVLADPEIKTPAGLLMSYILDNTREKENLCKHLSVHLGFRLFSTMPENKATYKNCGKQIGKCIYPPVERWIKGFMDAQFVITDSFHGCVFSILFNKPFIAIANSGRGKSRFVSLLNMFGLRERLIAHPQDCTPELMDSVIDWKSVNSILEEKRKESLHFLKLYL